MCVWFEAPVFIHFIGSSVIKSNATIMVLRDYRLLNGVVFDTEIYSQWIPCHCNTRESFK